MSEHPLIAALRARESADDCRDNVASTVELWRIELKRKDPPPPAGAANVMAAPVRQAREEKR